MRTVKLSKPWLRRISRLLLLCLAFQNVAVAAYACPMQAAPVAVAASAVCRSMAAAKCTRMAMPDSALCVQHCAADRVMAAASADLQVPLAFLSALPPMLPAHAQPLLVAIACATPHAPPPQPIRTRYCSLLI